jgi:hypothetical protein
MYITKKGFSCVSMAPLDTYKLGRPYIGLLQNHDNNQTHTSCSISYIFSVTWSLYTWITLSPTSLLTMLEQQSFTKCSILFQKSYEKICTGVYDKTRCGTRQFMCYYEQHHLDGPFIFIWIPRLIKVQFYVLVITSILNLYLQIAYICKNSQDQWKWQWSQTQQFPNTHRNNLCIRSIYTWSL